MVKVGVIDPKTLEGVETKLEKIFSEKEKKERRREWMLGMRQKGEGIIAELHAII